VQIINLVAKGLTRFDGTFVDLKSQRFVAILQLLDTSATTNQQRRQILPAFSKKRVAHASLHSCIAIASKKVSDLGEHLGGGSDLSIGTTHCNTSPSKQACQNLVFARSSFGNAFVELCPCLR